VDFDPVRAKAEGRDTGLPKEIAELFPDSFEESELGEIPRGWGVGTFNDVVDMLREQVNPQAFPTTPFQHYSLPAHDDGKVPAVELGADIKSNKFVVTQDVVLMSKLNPTIERVWLVDLEGTERAIASTEFLVLRPRAPYGVAYTYCLARDASFRRQVQELVTGTSNSHQRAQAGLVLGLRQILPSQAAVLAFESMTAPLLERVKRLRRESRTVTALRDTLMPPLISGQLRTADQQLLTGGARHGAN
jgi:type I restriction enzyme S subunit